MLKSEIFSEILHHEDNDFNYMFFDDNHFPYKYLDFFDEKHYIC